MGLFSSFGGQDKQRVTEGEYENKIKNRLFGRLSGTNAEKHKKLDEIEGVLRGPMNNGGTHSMSAKGLQADELADGENYLRQKKDLHISDGDLKAVDEEFRKRL
jgi:hypothetical protein